MSCDIEAARPTGRLHRVARRPDAWAWPDWAYAGTDGTFGNRYDDPRGEYRVLYASSGRLAAFVEVLARFRPEPAVVRELDRIELEPDERDDGPQPGQLPRSWPAGRVVGSALADGPYAAVGAARSLAYLRDRLGDRALHHGVDELDAAAIRAHVPRGFTQEVSRLVFECTDAGGEPQFDGIAYRSRLGDELENWAIYEPPSGEERLRQARSEPVDPHDRDLAAALQLLGIELV
jgi:RES domain